MDSDFRLLHRTRQATFQASDRAIHLDDSAEILQNSNPRLVSPNPARYFIKSFRIVVYVNVYMYLFFVKTKDSHKLQITP